MSVPVADVHDLDVRQSLFGERRSRVADVLAILKAAGITSVSGRDEPDCPPAAGARHRGERIGQERVPVPHAHEHRQVEPRGLEPLAETVRLRARQLSKGRDTTEVLVMMRHLFDTVGRNPTSTKHIGKKRPDVLGTVRTTKRDQQHGIERE